MIQLFMSVLLFEFDGLTKLQLLNYCVTKCVEIYAQS